MPKPILAFLQNRYLRPELALHRTFKNPDALDNRTPLGKAVWERMLATSRSGQCLRRHLGDELYNQIEWDNASPQIGHVASSAYPPDYLYMARCIKEEGNPPILIAFGAVARDGLRMTLAHYVKEPGYKPHVIEAPHPTRRPYPGAALDLVAEELQTILAKLG